MENQYVQISQQKNNSERKIDPAIIVAVIALFGTIIAAVFSSPAINKLIENWGNPVEQAGTPSSSPINSETAVVTGNQEKYIELNQTVTGTLYFNEAGVWIFDDGPATISVILDMGPYGEALIILRDPSGVDREYVDAQSGSEERLVNYTIPTAGKYSILVRNSRNSEVNYTLTVDGMKNPNP